MESKTKYKVFYIFKTASNFLVHYNKLITKLLITNFLFTIFKINFSSKDIKNNEK